MTNPRIPILPGRELPPLRKPTSLEVWTLLFGYAGHMDAQIVDVEELVAAADDAEDAVLDGMVP